MVKAAFFCLGLALAGFAPATLAEDVVAADGGGVACDVLGWLVEALAMLCSRPVAKLRGKEVDKKRLGGAAQHLENASRSAMVDEVWGLSRS